MASASTTIRVTKKTLRLLDELRNKFNAGSYEEVVLRLIYEYKRMIIEEYFGIDRGRISSFSEDDRGEDRDY